MSEKGLYNKYKVINQSTGEEVKCCFVLRPDKDPAAIRALEDYARHTDNHHLSDDITRWLAGPDLNPPLTEEDLSKMAGETIFTTHKGYIPCWGIDANPGSPYGPRIDCGEGRSISLHGFNEDWKAYRRKPEYLIIRIDKE